MKNLYIAVAFCLGIVSITYSQTVTIGTQTWTTKNLDVATYRNGDVIPQVQDGDAWENLQTGAWCYYENDAKNGAKYGKLYNWYAVNDKRGLARAGWHIPTDKEWKVLSIYLGEVGDDKFSGLPTGEKMKNSSGWCDAYGNADGNGNNSSGFSGLPGGKRNSNGSFGAVGMEGSWWSTSNEANADWGAFNVFLRGDPWYQRNYTNKKKGLSVRCVKD